MHVMPIRLDIHRTGRSAVRAEEIGADARARPIQWQSIEPDIDHMLAVAVEARMEQVTCPSTSHSVGLRGG
jgi:hypothetical protein